MTDATSAIHASGPPPILLDTIALSQSNPPTAAPSRRHGSSGHQSRSHGSGAGPLDVRSLDRRGPDRARRVAPGVAHRAAEHDRRPAGHRRSRDGRALRRLHRQRGDRRRLADLPRRRRLHQVAVHRHGRAGGALCRRERLGEGQPRRLPGVPDVDCALARRPRAARLRALPAAAAAGSRVAGGARRRAAVPADDVRVQPRAAALLHDGWRAARGGRRAHAACASGCGSSG